MKGFIRCPSQLASAQRFECHTGTKHACTETIFNHFVPTSMDKRQETGNSVNPEASPFLRTSLSRQLLNVRGHPKLYSRYPKTKKRGISGHPFISHPVFPSKASRSKADGSSPRQNIPSPVVRQLQPTPKQCFSENMLYPPSPAARVNPPSLINLRTKPAQHQETGRKFGDASEFQCRAALQA